MRVRKFKCPSANETCVVCWNTADYSSCATKGGERFNSGSFGGGRTGPAAESVRAKLGSGSTKLFRWLPLAGWMSSSDSSYNAVTSCLVTGEAKPLEILAGTPSSVVACFPLANTAALAQVLPQYGCMPYLSFECKTGFFQPLFIIRDHGDLTAHFVLAIGGVDFVSTVTGGLRDAVCTWQLPQRLHRFDRSKDVLVSWAFITKLWAPTFKLKTTGTLRTYLAQRLNH
ncbi:hypothetical protein B0H13DRAFT_1921529 [Mycena leptocephala]|nr:hypothetical protein B0H13DRAFT_1921529 [Mycena leptocephala]